MKTKSLIILVLGVLILLAGCTNELGAENDWRLGYTGKRKRWETNAEIVFEPGDKCSMTIYKDASPGGFAYKIAVKDDTHDNYIIAAETLDEGYTIEDLRAYTIPYSAPLFANLISFDVVDPGSTTFMANITRLEADEIFFTCMVQGPDEWKIIGVLGPLPVTDPYASDPSD